MSTISNGAKRILVVIVADYRVTGVTSFLEERLPKLNERCGSEITLFVPGRIVDRDRAEYLVSKGIKIVEGLINLEDPVARRLGLKRRIREILLKSTFDTVHVNTGSRLVNAIVLSEAKKFGVPIRIAHSHSANTTLGYLAKIVEPFYQWRVARVANIYLACSDEAGEFMCGKSVWQKKGRVIPNGIDVEKYTFSWLTREKMRAKMGIHKEEVVYGFIGRFSQEKNPFFLVDVCKEIAKENPNSVFWMIGDGPLKNESENRAQDDCQPFGITFLGVRNDVADLLQGMDALLLPSLHEGVPLALIEAQTSGIPCFVSDGVPNKGDIDGCRVIRLSLAMTSTEWAHRIIEEDLTRDVNAYKKVKNAGFDVNESVDVLCEFYK